MPACDKTEPRRCELLGGVIRLVAALVDRMEELDGRLSDLETSATLDEPAVTLAEMERRLLTQAIARRGRNAALVARDLGIAERTARQKIRKIQ